MIIILYLFISSKHMQLFHSLIIKLYLLSIGISICDLRKYFRKRNICFKC